MNAEPRSFQELCSVIVRRWAKSPTLDEMRADVDQSRRFINRQFWFKNWNLFIGQVWEMLELMQHTPMSDLMTPEEAEVFTKELARIRAAIAELPHIAK